MRVSRPAEATGSKRYSAFGLDCRVADRRAKGQDSSMASSDEPAPPSHDVASRIRVIRGRRVLIDADLAELYGVSTRRLNEAVKRNIARFPEDFVFRISVLEAPVLMSQIATSSSHGGRRKVPFVFTEHGALMAASVINSARAVQMSVYVVRAFVRMREIVSASPDLAGKLADLEKALASLDRETRERFREVYAAIRALTALPQREERQIGFTAPTT